MFLNFDICILDTLVRSFKIFADAIYYCQVAQIRIGNKEFPLNVIHLAVGAELGIPLSYYDSLGIIVFFISIINFIGTSYVPHLSLYQAHDFAFLTRDSFL